MGAGEGLCAAIVASCCTPDFPGVKSSNGVTVLCSHMTELSLIAVHQQLQGRRSAIVQVTKACHIEDRKFSDWMTITPTL